MLISLFREIVYIASLPLGEPGWAFGVGFYALITALTTNQRCWRMVVNVP